MPTGGSAAATAEPSAADLLPAPLLFITDRNELARIEVDGASITTLTREDDLIIDFAVGPNGGPLAFITVAEGEQRAHHGTAPLTPGAVAPVLRVEDSYAARTAAH